MVGVEQGFLFGSTHGCIFQRHLCLQVIRTACEGCGEQWPNIEQRCVICLTFIQLCFSGFECGGTGGVALIIEIRSGGSLPEVVLGEILSCLLVTHSMNLNAVGVH